MTDHGNRIFQNIDPTQLQQTTTTASLARLTDEDVVTIWDSVSAFIESYLKQSKGVTIPGFGTFSFIQKRIDVGNNKHLLIQRPVFVLAEKVVQNHGFRANQYPVNGSIPVHPLNYSFLQTQSNYSRDQIEQCVKHVLQIFHRSVAAQRNVEFTFSRIGKLQIRNNKVKMRFFRDFIQSVDETAGKHVIEAMCNRPQTSDSVMSEREAGRPATASNVVLPRLNSRIGNSSMQIIHEEQHVDEDRNDNAVQSEENGKNDDFKLPALLESFEETTNSQPAHLVKTSGPSVSQDNAIPIASLFSTTDLIQPSSPTKKATPAPSSNEPPMPRRSVSVLANESRTINPSGNNSTLGFTRPPIGDRRFSSSLNLYSQKQPQTVEKPQTSCGHYGTGQELCHLCVQRAKRNIPIFLHEEKRLREMAEDKLLEDYRHNKEVEEQKQRELKLKAAREEKQRIAAFNLGVAEAKRAERPQTTEIPRSLIFRKRIQTPPHFLRQQDLARQLEAQMKSKKDEQQTEKQDKDFTERLEQIQLAQSLAQERETYFKNKRLHQDEMRSALDDQIRNKPTEMPVGELETPYFGLNDTTKEKIHQRRLQAIDLLRQQKELVEQRQRQELLRQIEDQEYETRVLKTIKDDLLTDRRERFRRTIKIRQDLEKNWTQAAEEKQQRDEDERQHLFAPQGLLVHEQCDQYKRCVQCQRTLDNRGQSNYWKDTRYIPGTHIMV